MADVDYLGDIARKRRENYFKYKKYLKQTGISLLFSEIGSNDVPQVVPIIDTKGSLTKFLREVGIGAYQWPGNEIPKQVSDSPSLYPNSIDLNTKVVCLPVHQSLNSNMILNVISNIERWKEV